MKNESMKCIIGGGEGVFGEKDEAEDMENGRDTMSIKLLLCGWCRTRN